MRIIIEIKDTARLSDIENLSKDLNTLKHGVSQEVIKSISKEW